MLVKVVAVQSRLGEKLTLEEKLFIFKQQPDFICFPEYCLIDKTLLDYSRAALMIKDNLEYLRNFSEALNTCLIGGSVVEAEGDSLYNSCYIFRGGKKLGKYRKLNPVGGELEKGILPGDRIFTAVVDGINIGILICADALNPELFQVFREREVDIIFIPTTSRYRPGERRSEKHRRDNEIYIRGARAASSFIVKTCGVGSLMGRSLQGRTLIAAPWGVIKRVDIFAESSKCIITSVLDIDEIRDFRRKQRPGK
jgi:predicted amidohydrolase